MYLQGKIPEGLKMCELWSEGHTTIAEMFPPPIEPFTQWPNETNDQRGKRGKMTREEVCKEQARWSSKRDSMKVQGVYKRWKNKLGRFAPAPQRTNLRHEQPRSSRRANSQGAAQRVASQPKINGQPAEVLMLQALQTTEVDEFGLDERARQALTGLDT